MISKRAAKNAAVIAAANILRGALDIGEVREAECSDYNDEDAEAIIQEYRKIWAKLEMQIKPVGKTNG